LLSLVSGFTVLENQGASVDTIVVLLPDQLLDLLSLIGKKNAVMSSQRSLWKRRCVIVPEV
jgi:hypothetical protein